VREVLLVDMDNKAFVLEPCTGTYSLYIYTHIIHIDTGTYSLYIYTHIIHIDTQLGNGLRARSSARGHGQQGVSARALHGYIFTIHTHTQYIHTQIYSSETDCVCEVLLVDMDNKAFLLEPCAGQDSG